MGRGRKPVPTKIKKQRGTARHDRMLSNEIQPDLVEGIPDPPDMLNDDGSELWKLFCLQAYKLGMLTKIAYPQIVDYCLQWQVYCYNARLVAKSKTPGVETYTNKNRGLNVNYKAMNEARKEMKAFEANWGLNPSAQTKVAAGTPEEARKGSRFSL